MIPTIDQCYEMMEKYGMLENIRAHSIMVEKVAGVMGRELRKAGKEVSLARIAAGALLHDIAKTQSLSTREDHAVRGSEICIANHFVEVADIVREHVILTSFHSEGEVTEKEVIYYSDKRINHDQLVSIEERKQHLFIRYAKGNKRMESLIEENFATCRRVEKKLFSLLDFSPEDLSLMI
jgi:uncharacterized protein